MAANDFKSVIYIYIYISYNTMWAKIAYLWDMGLSLNN